jgi:hypothetical protein
VKQRVFPSGPRNKVNELVVTLKEREHLEDQGVGGKMGSEWILGRLAWGCVDWIQLAQDSDRWRDVVSAVMNLCVLAPQSYE